MANRKGVFIGAYVPPRLKESLVRRAAANQRTLSQEVTLILTDAVHGRRLPPGSVDRRDPHSKPRRRADDPFPRQRRADFIAGDLYEGIGREKERDPSDSSKGAAPDEDDSPVPTVV